MTLSDFLAASQGDERLAMTNWLRYVFWDRVLSPHPPKNNELPTVRFEDQADAVLAELARQRTDAWHKGHAEGVKSMTTI